MELGGNVSKRLNSNDALIYGYLLTTFRLCCTYVPQTAFYHRSVHCRRYDGKFFCCFALREFGVGDFRF